MMVTLGVIMTRVATMTAAVRRMWTALATTAAMTWMGVVVVMADLVLDPMTVAVVAAEGKVRMAMHLARVVTVAAAGMGAMVTRMVGVGASGGAGRGHSGARDRRQSTACTWQTPQMRMCGRRGRVSGCRRVKWPVVMWVRVR